MTEQEAIENFKGENKILSQYAETKFQKEVFAKKIERNNIAIKALEIMQELAKRNMTIEDLENYMQFEDECVKKNFTFKSLLEAREKQIPTRPTYEGDGCDKEGNIILDEWLCPNCNERYEVDYDEYDFCPNCGQAIRWE